MRTCVVVVLGILPASVSEMLPAAAIAAERQVFQFGSGETAGALIHDYADKWIEYGGAVERFSFVEVARSDDTIELLDAPRDVGLKVHADRGELRLPRSTAWQPWVSGRWTGLDELPGSIRFVPTDRKIRLAYFVPGDREPIEGYEQRIRVVMQFVAEIFRDDLRSKGERAAGLSFETDSAGEPIVHLIHSPRGAQYFNDAPAFDQVKHFQRVADEIPTAVGTIRRHTIVVFPETYEPGPAPIEWNGSIGRGMHTTADGGLAIMSAWILRDEFCAASLERQKKLILDATPIAGRTALGPRRPDSPRFEFIEDGFGATVHELGHALGLPHDYRSPNDLMGHGFRSLQVNYLPNTTRQKRIVFSRENARLLGASRYLNKEIDRNDNTPPTADVSVRIAPGASPAAVVSMKGADDRGLRAVVFFDPQHDTVIGGAELKGRQQSVNLKLPLTALKPGEFKLVTMLADQGGNIATLTTPAP
jgi:hypothetical protein